MTNNTTAPLPDNCPFCCGHAAPCLTSSHRTGVFVYCLSCLASTNDFDTKEEALAAWKMRQPTQSDAIVERLADALLPLAELYGGDVNMNDPLKKWLTIGHFADAKAALAALQEQSNG